MGSPPRASSGAKYAGVPVITPLSTLATSSFAREMPKSEILTVPAARPVLAMRMLPGLMSRCTIPSECAVAIAAATWAPMWAAYPIGRVVVVCRICATLRDGRYSMTSQGSPLSSARSCIAIALR
ncbi:hypothetical protein GCM10009619_01840 [Williamsia maris]